MLESKLMPYEFDACYGNERRTVRLGLYFMGKEGNSYNVTISNFYQGMMKKYKGEWFWYPTTPARCDITMADFLILGDIIDREIKNPGE